MICKYCETTMTHYDDEGSFTMVNFDSYICPSCFALYHDWKHPYSNQRWIPYDYDEDFIHAVRGLIWKVKRDAK